MSNDLADVSLTISEHGEFPPDEYVFENVTVRQGAERPWLETPIPAGGAAPTGNGTRLLGAVEVVGPNGATRETVEL